MRTLATLALTIGFVALASSASAVSSINVNYTGGSSAGPAVGDSVVANPSDLLSFDISVTVDAAGVAGLGFDLQWNDDANFSVASATWTTGTIFVSFAPFTSVTALGGSAVTTGGGVPAGSARIKNLGWFGLPPNPTSTQIFLGSVVFHVGAASNATLASGFFSTDGSDATNAAGTFITPNFGSFTVNPVPEPGLAALMGLGLVGLAIAGRRAKK